MPKCSKVVVESAIYAGEAITYIPVYIGSSNVGIFQGWNFGKLEGQIHETYIRILPLVQVPKLPRCGRKPSTTSTQGIYILHLSELAQGFRASGLSQ